MSNFIYQYINEGMPTKTSNYYNFTFRPTIDEFNKYKDTFMDIFQKKHDNEKYIVSYEKGKGEYINHIQGFIEFRKGRRADTLRKSFHTLFLKDMDIAYPKIALKVSPIVRDVNICQGYILKEYKRDDFDDVIVKGYDTEYLLKVYDDYTSLTLEKKVKIDAVRVNKRNIWVIFQNYLDSKKIDVKTIDSIDTIRDILFDMTKEGYSMFNLLLNKTELIRICRLLLALIQDNKKMLFRFDEDTHTYI